ncbi:MAG TPA: hypothetical protein VF053_03575 [Streptosporangiales bacterium]
MFTSATSRRWIGRSAWVMAWVGLLVGELHALARYATVDGRGDLAQPLTRFWAVPAAHALRPLLDWSGPYTVYLTYGKVWLPVFVAFTACALLVYRLRSARGFEKWAWRVALLGYGVATLSVLLEYFTPWTDQAFAALTLPGVLISMVGSTLLGIGLLRNGFRPRVSAVLLVACIPVFVAIIQVTSMGNAVLPLAFAFGIAGRRIARDAAADDVAFAPMVTTTGDA